MTDPTSKLGTGDHLTLDCDLESETQQALKELPFEPKFSWVKGHQVEKVDEDGCIIPLSREATVNNRVNVQAGECLQQNQTGVRSPSEIMPHLPAARATMVVHGRRITSNIQKEVQEAIHGTRLAKHIMERNHWSTSTFNLVDWDAHKIALKKQRNKSKT